MDYTYELMKDTNNTHIYIVVHREHPGLNRGQSDLQSDLPLMVHSNTVAAAVPLSIKLYDFMYTRSRRNFKTGSFIQ